MNDQDTEIIGIVTRITSRVSSLLLENKQLKKAIEGDNRELIQLRAEIATLQPHHHYMTKMGAELQEEVARLHEANKGLTAENKILRDHEAYRRRDTVRT